MREDFRLLTTLLAAFQTAGTAAGAPTLPATGPMSSDVTFNGTGFKAVKFIPGASLEEITRIHVIDRTFIGSGLYVSAGATGGFIVRTDANGSPASGFGTQGVVSFPGISLADAWVVGSRVVGAGGVNVNGTSTAAIFVLDGTTGSPIPGCGDPQGKVLFPPRTLTQSNITSLFPLSNGTIGASYLESTNASNGLFLSGVADFNVTSCTLVTPFGANGVSMATGDFDGTYGIALPTGGALIGGYAQPQGSSALLPGLFAVDASGKPTCGSAVAVLPQTPGVSAFPGGVAFDPYTNTFFLTGYISGTTQLPFVQQIQPNCTTTNTVFSFPGVGAPVGIGMISPTTFGVVINRPAGTQTNVSVVGFNTSGGAPFAESSALATQDVPPFVTGVGRLKDTQAYTTHGFGLGVQPDGKLVVGGGASVNGTSSLIARYIGVETKGSVIEFFNSILIHYFETADPNEAAAIDAGAAGPGWSRTGQTWKSGGPNRVCRFYGSPDINPATGLRRGPNSHFYTIDPDECAAVKLDPGWHFESYDYSAWPTTGGTCPAGTTPVMRAYNGRFAQNDSNHRYTISGTIYSQMIAMGWSGEGTVYCSAL